MSAIARLARDPSCIMAIDALGGARWLSPLQATGAQPSPGNLNTDYSICRKYWTDLTAALRGVGTGDFELEVSFKNTSRIDGKSMILSAQAGQSVGLLGVNVPASALTQYRLFIYAGAAVGGGATIAKLSAADVTYTDSAYSAIGIKSAADNTTLCTVKLARAGNVVTVSVDGTAVATITGIAQDLNTAMLAAPLTSFFPGVVAGIKLTVGGVTRYEFNPSTLPWAERSGLVGINAASDHGGYWAADAATSWSIKVPITAIPATLLVYDGAGARITGKAIAGTQIWFSATETVRAVLAYSRTLGADEIAAITKIIGGN